MTTSPNAIDVRTLDRHSKTGLATNARGDLHERFVMAAGVLARMRAETLISDIRPQKALDAFPADFRRLNLRPASGTELAPLLRRKEYDS